MQSLRDFNTAVTDTAVFLDFDGPASNMRTVFTYGDILSVDPLVMHFLNRICRDANARVVCTSRRAFTTGDFDSLYHETKTLFEKAAFDWRYMHPDWTVNKPCWENRKERIQNYLSEHPEINHYVIIDDEYVDLPNLVLVDELEGISGDHMRQIADILGIPRRPDHRYSDEKQMSFNFI